MDPTDDELEHLLETVRAKLYGSAAEDYAEAVATLRKDEAAGEIDRRQRLETSVLCALLLSNTARH